MHLFVHPALLPLFLLAMGLVSHFVPWCWLLLSVVPFLLFILVGWLSFIPFGLFCFPLLCTSHHRLCSSLLILLHFLCVHFVLQVLELCLLLVFGVWHALCSNVLLLSWLSMYMPFQVVIVYFSLQLPPRPGII